MTYHSLRPNSIMRGFQEISRYSEAIYFHSGEIQISVRFQDLLSHLQKMLFKTGFLDPLPHVCGLGAKGSDHHPGEWLASYMLSTSQFSHPMTDRTSGDFK